MSVALSNLPLPADCIYVINSFAFLDPVQYKNKLIKKSLNIIFHMTINVYNWPTFDDLEALTDDMYAFKCFNKQYQMWFCKKCGNYIDGEDIPIVCRCKCV